jgi:hypothetical protein
MGFVNNSATGGAFPASISPAQVLLMELMILRNNIYLSFMKLRLKDMVIEHYLLS